MVLEISTLKFIVVTVLANINLTHTGHGIEKDIDYYQSHYFEM